MEPVEYEKLHRLEEKYWWFVGRRRLVGRLVRKYVHSRGCWPMVLDVGCGAGATARELGKLGTVVALDVSVSALAYTAERGMTRLVAANGEALPFKPCSFDLVTALDVLEHMEHDLAGAQEAARVLRPQGVLIATVPACPILWSKHDVALHHYRRYTAAQFRQLMVDAGLRVLKLSYCMTALFPTVLVARLLQKHLRSAPVSTTLPEVGGPTNRLLTTILMAEAAVITRTSLPMGVSLACVAQKEGC